MSSSTGATVLQAADNIFSQLKVRSEYLLYAGAGVSADLHPSNRLSMRHFVCRASIIIVTLLMITNLNSQPCSRIHGVSYAAEEHGSLSSTQEWIVFQFDQRADSPACECAGGRCYQEHARRSVSSWQIIKQICKDFADFMVSFQQANAESHRPGFTSP